MTIHLIIWGVVFALMVIAELTSLQLVSIWFAAGAAAAFITALFETTMWVQLIIFVLVSLLLLIATRPLLKKIKVRNVQATDISGDIGKTAVIIEEVNNDIDKGRARINGVDWKAVSINDEIIPKGSIVKICDIKGTKMYVTFSKEKIKN